MSETAMMTEPETETQDWMTHTIRPEPLPDRNSRQGILDRCPRLTAHLICGSLGYATPSCAAGIIADAHAGRQNFCEWIYSCYKGDPKVAVRIAIQGRKHHRGYMADYGQARAIVEHARTTGREPVFASWF